ncbi:MAG TPA: ATP-binding protein [Thermoanaerobaculia bacterium]|jgi:hypothetical protein|nr:ATP-binding protein [Thermoanaerobaculia bacterium]
MIIPRTIDDLNALITNQVVEDLHLDYKRSAAFDKALNDVKTDLSKDVSAFANSDGGVLVYSVVEDNATKLPVSLDSGVDHTKWTRERIESLINAYVSPRVDSLEVHQIRLSSDRSAYIIAVPKSARGPHQERMTFRYYKRFNFSSEAMEDYEIQDVRSRRDVVLPLISVDVDIYHGVLMHLIIENIGDIPAEDVQFKVTPDTDRLTSGRGVPNILTRGARFIPPKKVYRLCFGSAIKEVRKEAAPKFDVEVSYLNRRAGRRISESVHIDLADYFNTAIVESDVYMQGEKIEESIQKLTREVSTLNKTLALLTNIAGPTGLDLSVTSFRNFKHLLAGRTTMERIPATTAGWRGLMEVLGIDRTLALRLEHFVHWPEGRLEDIEGMTPENSARARAAFFFEFEEPDASEIAGGIHEPQEGEDK